MPVSGVTGARRGRHLRDPGHGEHFLRSLSVHYAQKTFSDVKLVCGDGEFWVHSLLLGAVSPFLKTILLDLEALGQDCLTLFLPHIRSKHLELVLDYIYQGSMFICSENLSFVVRIIEMLDLKCGVSVSKIVHKAKNEKGTDEEEEEEWVEENIAKFQDISTSSKWIDEVYPVHQVSEVQDDDDDDEEGGLQIDEGVMTEEEEEEEEVDEEPPVEVRPPVQSEEEPKQKRRKTDLGYDVIDVGEDSDSESDDVEDVMDDADPIEEAEGEGGPAASKESSAPEDSAIPVHKCVMCGKTFSHQKNLAMHIQSHLGRQVQMMSCKVCNRTFRSSLELTLHLDSHKHSKSFKSIRTLNGASARENHLRKYLIKRSLAVLRKNKITSELKTQNPDEEHSQPTPANKDIAAAERSEKGQINKEKVPRRKMPKKKAKSVGGEKRKSVKQAVKEAIPNTKLKIRLPVPTENASPSKKKRRKNCAKNDIDSQEQPEHESSSSEIQNSRNEKEKLVRNLKLKIKPIALPVSFKECNEQTESVMKNSKKNKKSKKSRERKNSKSEPSKLKRSPSKSLQRSPSKSFRNTEDSLTCPTCDKTFIARSIFERHLKTAQHGEYEPVPQAPASGFSSPASVYGMASPSPLNLPHLNPVLQPTMEIGGREVNKYECHLCNQVFLRVKDLAKHRNKTCTAWMT